MCEFVYTYVRVCVRDFVCVVCVCVCLCGVCGSSVCGLSVCVWMTCLPFFDGESGHPLEVAPRPH